MFVLPADVGFVSFLIFTSMGLMRQETERRGREGGGKKGREGGRKEGRESRERGK
jgi:hypothetical protein